jgi:hypothetical protein
MQLAAQQGAADRAHRGGVATAAHAADRQARMLQAAGGYASGLHGQDYREKANAASAQDRINMYNAGETNRSKYYNSGLEQQEFANQMGLNDRRYGAHRTRGNDYEGYAEDEEAFWGDMGRGLGEQAKSGGEAFDAIYGMNW